MTSRSVRVVAVGDLQLGDSPTSVGFGFRSSCSSSRLADVLSSLTPILRGADIAFANLETPLSDRDVEWSRWRSRQMRGDPRYAAVLGAAGFSVLNVANNHAAQHGNGAFHDTVAALAAAGVGVCGARGTGPWTSQPVRRVTAAGLVGVLGYCLRPRQYDRAEPPYAEGTLEAICADVERLRSERAVVVVSLHWGEEFVSHPSAAEVAMGRAIVDAGAAVLVGHHPHVTRPVERYRGGLIAYSLGNCVGDMVWYRPFRRGLLLEAELTRAGVGTVHLHDTRLDRDYAPRVLASGPEPVEASAIVGLAAKAYTRAIASTWRAQRVAVYAYALLRFWRFPPAVLWQLVRRTLGNKLRALGRRPT